jgi:phosphatidylglycerophosphate synthase
MERTEATDPNGEHASSASRYRARHFLLPPTLISLSRVVFAACFPWVAHEPWLALALLALAGASDVVDGWVARRHGMVTATGAVVDGVTDKLFVLSVALSLLFGRHLSVGALLLLGTRELGELPLVLWLAVSPAARRARIDAPKANVLGKAATVMQFATVAAALARAPGVDILLGTTALLGLISAASYWRRELGNGRRAQRQPGAIR